MSVMIRAIEARIEELESKKAKNRESMQPMFKENSDLADEIYELQAQVLKLQSEAISTEEDMIKFYIHDDGRSDMDHYRAKKRFFNSIGLSTSGYNPTIEQVSFELEVYSGFTNAMEVHAGIMKVLPHMKLRSYDDYDDVKRFSIFEHTCSHDGSYSLLYDPSDSTWIITKLRYYSLSTIKVYTDLRDALVYISKNLSRDEPDEDDDYNYGY